MFAKLSILKHKEPEFRSLPVEVIIIYYEWTEKTLLQKKSRKKKWDTHVHHDISQRCEGQNESLF